MRYFSTNRKSPEVGFKEAVINSLPQDNGLYFPAQIPQLGFSTADLKSMTLPEMGLAMMRPFIAEIPEAELKSILEDVLSFEIPLVQVEEQIFSLELFHGPTLAFKDVGARFLARCLGYFNQQEARETTVLVATSGDTGGAVANGFFEVEGVKVIILYPSGKVSDLQEKQLTTLGGNITALEVDGDFDDCQAMVKQAFLDPALNRHLKLTSANSINIARWMPQSIYYAWLLQQINVEKPLIAVPSGNYGNLTAALLGKIMGLPLGNFLACANANDVVPRYLASGTYAPEKTVATFANAMDVNNPSNFPRLLELYHHSLEDIRSEIKGFSLADDQILATLQDCWQQNHYLLDPHGAIGYAGLKQQLQPGQVGVFLETAHPIKFEPTIKLALGDNVELEALTELMGRTKQSLKISKAFEDFKAYLMGGKM
jgi:threonine synthase